MLTRETTVSLTGVGLNLRASKVAEFDTISAIDLLSNDIDLLLDGEVQVVKELEVGFAFTDSDGGFGQISCAGASLGPVVTDDSSIGTRRQSLFTDESELGGRVSTVYILLN